MTRLIAVVLMAALASATSIKAATSTHVSEQAEEKFAVVSAKVFCKVWENKEKIAKAAKKAKDAAAKKHAAWKKKIAAIRKKRNARNAKKKKYWSCKRGCRWSWRCRKKCVRKYKYWAQTSAESLSSSKAKSPTKAEIKMMQDFAKTLLKKMKGNSALK